MGTHPIFESDFDCLTEKMAIGKLMSVIADEDTVTGFLLGGIGELNKTRQPNFMVCDGETEDKDIEEALKGFLSRPDIGIVIISQNFAEKVRHVIDNHTESIPTILEVPSKDTPYDPEKDSVVKRARQAIGGD